MNTSVKVFLSCAFGAFNGTLVALQLNHNFWWIGLLAGGFVVYISYEFKTVIQAVPIAWRAASGWQPDTELWRERFRVGFGFVAMFQTACVVICIPLAIHVMHLQPKVPMSQWPWVIITEVLLATHLLFWMIGFVMPGRNWQGELFTQPHCGYSDNNPVTVFFWHIPRGIFWLLVRIPKGVQCCLGAMIVIGYFGTYLFREIHSDIRFLCTTDAAIGIAIGYFYHNPIVGTVAGGILGVLDFEVLSIRMLKCVPASRSLFR